MFIAGDLCFINSFVLLLVFFLRNGVLCILACKGHCVIPKDVLMLLARALWKTREDDEWQELVDRET